MKLRTLISALPVLLSVSVPVSAQSGPVEGHQIVLTAQTDSISYTAENGYFVENLWRGGQIYRQRTVTEGAGLTLDWTAPEPPQPEPQTPGVVFAEGVTRDKGWYDVNKKEDGRTGKDGLMCWAAVCANMLQWWQDRYVEKYGSLPAHVPNGPGKEYELAIFEVYQTDWDNYYGSEVYYGIPWYMNGEDRTQNAVYVAKPLKPGGFFAAEWPDIEKEICNPYVYEVNGYSTWGDGWDVDTSKKPLDIFSDVVIDAIDNGMASISIRAGFSIMHALTLWGYEADENGRVKKIYVTNSDDLIDTPKAPRVQLMQEYDIVEMKDREVGISDGHNGVNAIIQVVPFKARLPK